MAEESKTRQQRREEARQLARLLLQDGHKKFRWRWDYTLACLLGLMAAGMALLPPQTPIAAGVWLVLMYVVGIYPTLHFAEWALAIKKKWLLYPIALLVLAGATAAFGKTVWPIQRYRLSAKKHVEFVRVLQSQTEPRFEVKIGCAAGSEEICLYAEQFAEAFEEAGWKIQGNRVERLVLPRPRGGILIFYGTGGTVPPNPRDFWIRLTPSLKTVQTAFKAIDVNYQMQIDSKMSTEIIAIAFYPEGD